MSTPDRHIETHGKNQSAFATSSAVATTFFFASPPQLLINFTHNENLRLRFLERVEGYSSMWSGLGYMSNKYVRDSEDVTAAAYAFLSEME